MKTLVIPKSKLCREFYFKGDKCCAVGWALKKFYGISDVWDMDVDTEAWNFKDEANRHRIIVLNDRLRGPTRYKKLTEAFKEMDIEVRFVK